MGLFARRTVDPPQESRSVSGPALFHYLNAYTSYGSTASTVQTAEALRTSAYWACVRVLAGSVSNLPIDVIRKDGDTRRKVDPQPSLIAEPSGIVERDVWVHQLVTSMFDDGNAWGWIAGTDTRGHPTFIETIAPRTVTNRRVEEGVPVVAVNGTDYEVFPHGPIWHVPGPMVLAGSPFGLSPRDYASGSIDATIAAQAFGTGFLSGGGIPSALLRLIGADPTQDQAQDAKDAFKRAATDRDLVAMGGSWEYEKIQVDPNESQFLELQRFIIEDVCRFMGVPPSMVYGAVSGQSVTYANVSQADLHYLKHSLEVPLSRLERALSKLIPRPQFVRFNRDALLRSDALTRWQVLDKRLRNKSLSIDEARAIEDEAPFGGDYGLPGIPGGPTDDATPKEGTNEDA